MAHWISGMILLLCVALFLLSEPCCGSDKAIVSSSNQLGFRLLQSQEENNLLLSPISITTALGMLYFGAGTSTKTELEKFLGLKDESSPVDAKKVGQDIKTIIKGLTSPPPNVTLYLANKAYIQNDEHPILQNYRNILIEYFKADIEEVNFSTGGTKLMDEINAWVKNATGGMIDKFLQNPVSEATKLILLNAIYFKGYWKYKFDKAATTLGLFYNEGVTVTKVKKMTITGNFRYQYVNTLNAYIVALPYMGDRFYMYVILPKEKKGIKMLENALAEQGGIEQYTTNIRMLKVTVTMPKFRLSSSTDVKHSLKNLGLETTFSGDTDLSGIDGSNNLVVTNVLHSAVVDVNEDGSEASALTGMVLTFRSLQADNLVIDVDHPFLFAIRDVGRNLNVFVGRVTSL